MSNIPTRLVHKHTSIQGAIPPTTFLEFGELALNYTDGKLYYKSLDQNGQPTIKHLATVNGEVSGSSPISNISINSLNQLVIATSDGNTYTTAKVVVGPQGVPGVSITGAKVTSGNLILERTGGGEFNVGNVIGPMGPPGAKVTSAQIDNYSGELVLGLNDNSSVTVNGSIIGPNLINYSTATTLNGVLIGDTDGTVSSIPFSINVAADSIAQRDSLGELNVTAIDFNNQNAYVSGAAPLGGAPLTALINGEYILDPTLTAAGKPGYRRSGDFLNTSDVYIRWDPYAAPQNQKWRIMYQGSAIYSGANSGDFPTGPWIGEIYSQALAHGGVVQVQVMRGEGGKIVRIDSHKPNLVMPAFTGNKTIATTTNVSGQISVSDITGLSSTSKLDIGGLNITGQGLIQPIILDSAARTSLITALKPNSTIENDGLVKYTSDGKINTKGITFDLNSTFTYNNLTARDNHVTALGATSSATANTLVKRGAAGEASFTANGVSGPAINCSTTIPSAAVYASSTAAAFGGGVAIEALSVNGTALNATSTSGSYHSTFGNDADNRSFIATEKGAFGWHRGSKTGRILAADLTDDQIYTLPNKTGNVVLDTTVNDVLASINIVTEISGPTTFNQANNAKIFHVSGASILTLPQVSEVSDGWSVGIVNVGGLQLTIQKSQVVGNIDTINGNINSFLNTVHYSAVYIYKAGNNKWVAVGVLY